MARGINTTARVEEREERTNELFTTLDSVTEPGARQEIIDTLTQVNLPLCDALARRYSGRGCDHDDLVQVARLGLLLAIDRYRPREGGSFAAFAVPTIVGELKRHFRDSCWTVRPPRRIQELRLLVRESSDRLAQSTGHEPSAAELASHLEAQPDDVRACLSAATSFTPVSLDAPAGHDSLGCLGDIVACEATPIEDLLLRLDVRRAIATLPLLERRVVRWRFVGELTQSQIALRLGVSQMQVSRILRRALDRLRNSLEGDWPLAS
ncbi:MAG TPA: sigma-70 family RNA polymerase sigma factor [Arachnia sp.]|nr:sigma-70 family RNA polymerase sigma factor [Arachnia sp.]HMT87447.1 sigma-70 family RNA polymerase sigma factor [Arachnia sp.]